MPSILDDLLNCSSCASHMTKVQETVREYPQEGQKVVTSTFTGPIDSKDQIKAVPQEDGLTVRRDPFLEDILAHTIGLSRQSAEGLSKGDVKGFYAVEANGTLAAGFSDGTKTLAKCAKGDTYDPEVGAALCLAYKVFGGKNAFHKAVASMTSGLKKKAEPVVPAKGKPGRKPKAKRAILNESGK